MLYQLPDGRTVDISIEQYLSFSDEELKDLICFNHGAVVNNPMYGSSILKPGRPEPDEEVTKEIPDVTSEEKFEDQDYTEDEE